MNCLKCKTEAIFHPEDEKFGAFYECETCTVHWHMEGNMRILFPKSMAQGPYHPMKKYNMVNQQDIAWVRLPQK